MLYQAVYHAPVGLLTLVSSGEALLGLWLEGQAYFGGTLRGPWVEKAGLPLFGTVTDWLNRYFAGERPPVTGFPLAPVGSSFRREVWRLLCDIPYGTTVTYGTLAKQVAQRMGKPSMSAQAIGGAVGHNPISILIPCHRVVGSDGSLTGYAGGIEKKRWLLSHEGVALPEGKAETADEKGGVRA